MKNEGKLTTAQDLLYNNGMDKAIEMHRLAYRSMEISAQHAYKQLFDEYLNANPSVPYIELQCTIYTDGVAVRYIVDEEEVSEYTALYDVLQELCTYEQIYLGYWASYVASQDPKGSYIRCFVLRFSVGYTMPQILDITN